MDNQCFYPCVHVQPTHSRIKEAQFDLEWIRSLNIIFNPLGNLGESINYPTLPLRDAVL